MKMISLTVLCLCVQQVLNFDIHSENKSREARKLFGGYRITPRYCKATKDVVSNSKGVDICMFNHECGQRNGQVVGACMDGFLFGTCCRLPIDVVGDLTDSDLQVESSNNSLYQQQTSQPLPTHVIPSIGQLTSNGVSQIANTLLGVLPTAQDNAVVQVDIDSFSTPGIVHSTAPDTVLQNIFNEINSGDFKPFEEKFTTIRAGTTTPASVYDTNLYPSTMRPYYSTVYSKPIFKPKPQQSIHNQYVLVPTISHETKPNKSQEIESIVNIIQMLNTSTSSQPTQAGSTQTTSKFPGYIFSTNEPYSTKKPPSTSYIFSTTPPPRRPGYTPSKVTTKPTYYTTSGTKLTTLKTGSTKYSVTNGPYISSTTFRPAHSTFANSPDAFVNTKKPPSTSYIFSSTISKKPSLIRNISTTNFDYPPTPASSSLFSTYPSPPPTVIVLSSPTNLEHQTPTTNNVAPNVPLRKPITQVTINNHITHNIYSTSERPAPTVLITPKPSSTIGPYNDFPDLESVSVEAETSPNDLNNFPPVRNPNLNMSIPIILEDDITTPEFVEDDTLNLKVESFVNKIILGLQEPFGGLQDVVLNNSNNTISPNITNSNTTKKPIKRASTTKKPVTKPYQGTNLSTKPTSQKVTTKKPVSTVTKKPTPTGSKKPTKKPLVTTSGTEQSTITTFGQDYRHVCGMRPLSKTGRIVGGKSAVFGEFPWQVLVRESTWLGLFTKNKCGGVLISNRYVMTAAHCQPGFLASLVAVFGEFDISGDLENKRALSRNIKKVIVHRQYDPGTFANDLALLELEHPIQFDHHIIPICLPRETEDFTGRMATVTGWGRLKYGGGVPSILQEVQVPIMENHVCQEMFRTAGHTKVILESFLCAGYANGQKDSCEGDSGGPLVLQRTDGRYQLAGTVSHGIKCAAPYLPGVYMRTAFYKPWIEAITGVH